MPPNNAMSTWGNEKTMNLNTLVLTNIQSSPYFKVNLFDLKTYHEVIDEIFYKVNHLEPWEKGSRKTAGQTGMCGGVRGVGAGGIVSSAYCLLYKLFTLKLTKKQLIGLLTHKDSPYIRGLGFMYIRYTQPPADLWAWFEDYLDDDEEIDVKAGGGHIMTIGEMARQWLVKLEWYATLFPRIPVPIEKDLAIKLRSRPPVYHQPDPEPEHIPDNQLSFGEAERSRGTREDARGDEDYSNSRGGSDNSYSRGGNDYNGRGGGDNHRGGHDSGRGGGDRDRGGGRGEYSNGRGGGDSRGSRNHSPADFPRRSPPSSSSHNRRQSPAPAPKRWRRSPLASARPSDRRSTSFERDLAREKDRQRRENDTHRSRSPRVEKQRDRRSRSHERRDERDRRDERRDERDRKDERRDERDRKDDHERRDDRERRDNRDRKDERERKDRRSRSREKRDSKRGREESHERRSRSRERGSSRGRDLESKGSHSRGGEPEGKSSSKHKRSHKEKKDKHRDRGEKTHKHKSHDKERR